MKPIVTVSACVAGILAVGFLCGQMLFSQSAPASTAGASVPEISAAAPAGAANRAAAKRDDAPATTASIAAPTRVAAVQPAPVSFWGPSGATLENTGAGQLPPLPSAPVAAPAAPPAAGLTQTAESMAMAVPPAPGVAGAPMGEGQPPAQRTPGSYTAIHTDGPYIAITFDDGPNPETTNKLLKMLAERNVKATFFVLGSRAVASPEILQAMVAAGHEVANHSWNHPQLNKIPVAAADKQIEDTNAVIQNATGVKPRYLRPPYGAMNATLQRHIEEKYGMTFIYWSVDPLDWKVKDANAVYEQIMRQVRPGAIILAHDIHPTTVAAMPRVLDALIAKGYKFMTISDLIAQDKPPPKVAAATPAAASAAAPPKKKPAKPAQASTSGGSKGPVNISPVPVSATSRPPAAVPSRPPASAGIY